MPNSRLKRLGITLDWRRWTGIDRLTELLGHVGFEDREGHQAPHTSAADCTWPARFCAIRQVTPVFPGRAPRVTRRGRAAPSRMRISRTSHANYNNLCIASLLIVFIDDPGLRADRAGRFCTDSQLIRVGSSSFVRGVRTKQYQSRFTPTDSGYMGIGTPMLSAGFSEREPLGRGRHSWTCGTRTVVTSGST